MTQFRAGLPFFVSGKVVKGFGRGSKELGIPTANFSDDVVEKLPKEIDTGIYFGFASVDNGPVHKMVMSVGWNPFYKNIKKSMVMETHIIYTFPENFYGSLLKVIILGYIRPEQSYDSLDALITAIQNDIATAKEALSSPEYSKYQSDSHFHAIETSET